MIDVSTLTHLALVPEWRAKEDGDTVAVSMDNRSFTYSELNARTERLARALRAAGLGAGERVAFVDKNSLRFFEIFFGSLRAGGVLVALNFRLAAPEMQFIISDAECRFIFVGREFYALVESIEHELPANRCIVAIDGGHDRWLSLDDWLQTGTGGDLPELDADADVLQLYTSGTTGLPKGAYVSNRAWIEFSRAATLDWGAMSAADTQLICMPLCHIAGINTALLGFLQGASNIVMRDVVPQQILECIERDRITITMLAPAILQAVLLAVRQSPGDYSSLRLLSYGASPIAAAVLDEARKVFGCDFVHLYGLTECLGAGTFLAPEDHDPERGKLRSCGRAYRGGEVRVVDDAGNEVAAGEVGEIEIRAPWLMTGYWKRPDATAETIHDGWLRTGDAGYRDADGYLYIHDRVKDMIVSGGENIYPAEVENALFSHSAVADVAVIGVPDEKWGEAVKAIVVLAANCSTNAQELIDFARARIAGYKLPKSVDFVDALPRNASGKVLRRELREPYWAGRERRVN